MSYVLLILFGLACFGIGFTLRAWMICLKFKTLTDQIKDDLHGEGKEKICQDSDEEKKAEN